MQKANLFIIGASKCGTTSFYNILKEHPDICMSSIKETSYFSLSKDKKNDIKYHDYYKSCGSQRVLGEVSPIYSELHVAPWTAKNIYKYNSEAKIIYIIRNPIDRLKSVWKQTLHTGHWKEKVYLKRFGINVPKMDLNFKKAVFNYPAFLDACKYWFQINGYRKFYPDNQINVIFFEDFISSPEIVFEEVFSFLNIKDFDISNLQKQHNKSFGKKMMNPKIQPIIDTAFVKKIKDLKIFTKLKSYAKKLIYKEIPSDIEINEDLKSEILEELDRDIKEILDYANKDSCYWSFK